jgi:hypothetical protein
MVIVGLIFKLFYLALKYKVNLEVNMDHLYLQVQLLQSFSPSSLLAKLTWAEGIRGLVGEKGLVEEDWNNRHNLRKKII